MNPNRPYLSLSGLVILMTIVACVIPGQTTQPVSITNPSSVETSLASTARALAQQTETANGFTATPIIIPTDTLTPTPKISLTGTSLITQEDQSTLFIDHKLGFQLFIPAGWLATRINEDEYFKAFTLDVVLENPAINERLTKINSFDMDHFRLDAIDIRPGHVVNGMISDITVVLQFESELSLEEWAKLKSNRADLLVGYQRLSAQFEQTTNGTRVLVIEESWNINSEDKLFLRRVFFKLPSGTVTLDFQTLIDFKDTVLPDFEQVVNSLTSLNP